jgi:glutathione synthase/RimK-type ligase-like ATP-grasp enzyme
VTTDSAALPFTALFGVGLPHGEPRGATIDAARMAAELFPRRASGRRDRVLILADQEDKHADAVAVHLIAAGTNVVRFDISAFPRSGTMSFRIGDGRPASVGMLADELGSLALEEVRSVWLRPDHRELFGIDPPATHIGAFIRRESQGAFDGLVALLDDAFWVSSPSRLVGAGSKVRQLALAEDLRLTVPRTLVTNDPVAAERFVADCDRDVVVKAFRGVIGPHSQPSIVYTTRVLPDRMADLPLVRNAPCIFQERIPNVADVRVTVVGRTLFAVEIAFQPEDATDADWRKVENAETEYRVIALPAGLQAQCRTMMDRLGLATATIDFIRRPDGEYVFLEVNPQANWLWLEMRTGLPISRTMASLLARGALEG